MFGVEVTDYDRKVWEEELRDFLPDKIIDCHVHLWTQGMEREGAKAAHRKGMVDWTQIVAPDLTVEDLMESYSQMFPGKDVKAVIMGWPSHDLKKTNDYAIKVSKEYGFPAFYCTSWDTPADEIRDAVLNRGFIGIKPYLNNSPSYIPAAEVRIFDYLTHEHLRVADELGAVVMLHIPRSMRLRDPVNLAQMLEINDRYPNAKVIIAHIGRAYSVEDFGDAFEVMKRAENLYWDFTANCLAEGIENVIKMAGVDRVMFGSDMPITKMRMYRITENGKYLNVVPRGIYGDVSNDPNMRETDETDITTFMYEELRAFKKAAQRLNLSREDVEKILCRNAAKLFGMEI